MPSDTSATAVHSVRQVRPLPRDGLSRFLEGAKAGGAGGVGAASAPWQGPAPTPPRRDRLWELSENLHCSIVGTCLTTADLRALLAKLGDPDARTMSEHTLHHRGVTMAGRKEGGGKLLHKLLDRRHAREVARLDRAGDREAVRLFWREAVDHGEVPGAYWAVLTHPLTDRAIVQEVYGEVHMLSHLVGRAVRADLRRLANLEEALAARDETVAELEGRVRSLTQDKIALSERSRETTRGPAPRPQSDESVRDLQSLEDALAQAHERLARAEAHACAEGERRAVLEKASAALARNLEDALRDEALLRCERDSLEGALAEQLGSSGDPTSHPLDGLVALYVGGRPQQVAQARRLVERRGGTLLTHDGGVEENTALLPGLVARAAIVLAPVDCVSHAAMIVIKRCCREGGATLVPLRTASLAALIAALREVSTPDHLGRNARSAAVPTSSTVHL